MAVKHNPWEDSFRPSASICGRTYTCKLAAGLLPARHEARVAGQGISTGTGVVWTEKRLESCNCLAKMHVEAHEDIY